MTNQKFYFYLLKKGGGKIDPRNIDFMIDTLKEWLPESITDEETNPDKLWYNDFRNGYNKYRNDVIGNLE